MLLCVFVSCHVVFHKRTVYFMTHDTYDDNGINESNFKIAW